MSSEMPAMSQREALHADITATRAELGRTLEAIAAKTQVKTRAKHAAQETLVGVKDRVSAGASEVRSEAAGWWRRLRGLPTRSRLSALAVFGGALSAAVAVIGLRGFRSTRGVRSNGGFRSIGSVRVVGGRR